MLSPSLQRFSEFDLGADIYINDEIELPSDPSIFGSRGSSPQDFSGLTQSMPLYRWPVFAGKPVHGFRLLADTQSPTAGPSAGFGVSSPNPNPSAGFGSSSLDLNPPGGFGASLGVRVPASLPGFDASSYSVRFEEGGLPGVPVGQEPLPSAWWEKRIVILLPTAVL